MDDDFWIDMDIEGGRIIAERLLRICPKCHARWSGFTRDHLWHRPVQCPHCGTWSVRESRLRTLIPGVPARRIVAEPNPSGGDRHRRGP